MSWAGAVVLLLGGLGGALIAWNAARPPIDPTRWYSPLWLPAMIVTELVGLWLGLDATALVVGVALGGLEHGIGRVGAVLLGVAIVLLVWVIARTWRGVRRLGAHVDGPVHTTHWRASWLGAPPPTPAGVVEHHHVPFDGGSTADVIRPDDGRSDLPVFLFVHGGGWTGGDPQRSSRDIYHALALDGWAAVAIRYPFAPHATVADQIEVVRRAVAWVTDADGSHGIRASALVVGGGSAGGLLAATAVLADESTRRAVDALVGLYGVYDIANRYRTHARWLSVERVVMKARYRDAPEAYEAVSPIDHVGDDTPPVLLVHGTHDTLVPFGEARLFERTLRDAGRPVDVIPVHGAQHAYDAISGITSRTAAAAIRTWLTVTVLRTETTPSSDRATDRTSE